MFSKSSIRNIHSCCITTPSGIQLIGQKVITNEFPGVIKISAEIKGWAEGPFIMSKNQSLSDWSVQRRSTWTNRNQANDAPAPAAHSERSNETNAKVLAPIRKPLRPKRVYWRRRWSISERYKQRSSSFSWTGTIKLLLSLSRGEPNEKLHAVAD